MDQNGSRAGAKSLSSDSHDEFVELCALASSGELTGEEWKCLHEHLKNCASCRTLKREYDAVAAQAIPSLAAGLRLDSEEIQIPSHWSLELAEAKLMKRLAAESAPTAPVAVSTPGKPRWKRMLPYALAAAALLACLLGSFRLGMRWSHAPEAIGSAKPVTASVASTIKSAPPELLAAYGKLEADSAEIDRLQTQLRGRLAELDRLKAEKLILKDGLKQSSEDLNQAAKDRNALNEKLAQAESASKNLQDKLTAISKRESDDAGQLAGLQVEVNGLRSNLEQQSDELADSEELLKHDRDIRNLMGARNLYIAEIYDVGKTGDTKKPFGRIFYTKDKSLIFYGYDLDQQAGVKNASTFQAWGRSRPGDQDVSLGIFYKDDSNKKRWILKCDDPKTLARLDAVFVTVEPKGGSQKPTGKPLLFAYLRMEPNHP